MKPAKIDLKVRLTRDSVAAGDDIDAPHQRTLTMNIVPSWEGLCGELLRLKYMARIHGGEATWVGVAHRPFAIFAQQWPSAELLPAWPPDFDAAVARSGELRIHFCYLGQIDPHVARDVLKACRFHV